MENDAAERDPSPYEVAAWGIAAASLFLVLRLHLLSALMAGLIVFELVHLLAAPLRITRLTGLRARIVAVGLLAVAVIVLLILGVWGLVAFFRSEVASLSALFRELANIIESSRTALPAFLRDVLPSDAEELRRLLVESLRRHSQELQTFGAEMGRAIVHAVIGMVIGGVVSLEEARPPHEYGPLSGALLERFTRVAEAFRRIVFAQVRISAVNTVFAWGYLVVALPLAGVHLPLTKTLVAVTFVTGLLPVIGNLISNTMIVVVSLSHSPTVALASLAFLVVIHKLEYFLNAKIIGGHISARAWELLVAMLVMESAFGTAGVIAAPVYYAYVKGELTDRGLL